MNATNKCPDEVMSDQERRLLNEEGFIWDIVVQLCQLRESRGLTQSQLAERMGTKQQAVSRLESPGYGRHSLSVLRRVAEKLGAYIDVVMVPEEKLSSYLDARYQPVLMEEAPSAFQVVGNEVLVPQTIPGDPDHEFWNKVNVFLASSGECPDEERGPATNEIETELAAGYDEVDERDYQSGLREYKVAA